MNRWIVILVALAVGLFLLSYDQRTDDTGVEVGLLVATSLALTVAAPRAAIAVALAIGLGTISLDLVIVIVLTSWFRRRMNDHLWRWIHRASYLAFVALFLHAYLAGTDFDSPLISSISWSAAGGLALLALSRVFFGRLAE